MSAIAVSCMECGTSGILENQLLPPAPVVTSASSQYFERIFSRLLVMPPVLEAPVFNPELPRQPAFQPPITNQEESPTDVSSVAFAVATAQAAPVSTLLLPPFPFSQPQTIAFIAPVPPINVQDPANNERDIEPTTERKNSNLELEETTTSLPSTAATEYKQGLPSDDNVNFHPYLPPTPQKEKTSVEVVPVPLTYFTPPPPTRFRQTTKHFYIPAKTKITIIPSPPKLGLHVPARIIIHKIPKKFNFLAKYLPKKIVKHLHFVIPASSNTSEGGGGAAPYSYDKPSSGFKLP